MKKLLVIFLLISCVVSAKENSMMAHKDNYFVGGKEDLKFQISAKYCLIYPFETGLYFAYTETAYWDIYKESAPFREFNHNPEVFWQSGSLGVLDFIKLSPYEHKSNGRDGDESRGIDRYYGEIQLSFGSEYVLGTNVKGWKYYKVSKKNKDIKDYSGYFQAEVFFKIMGDNVSDLEKEKLFFRGGCNKNYRQGWVEAGIVTRIITSYIQPRFFIIGFYGYGESLVDYNVKEKQIKAGVIF